MPGRFQATLVCAGIWTGVGISAFAQPDTVEEAQSILETVHRNMPTEVIAFEARVETLNRQGDVRHVHNLDATLDFSGPLPTAAFTLRDRFGDFLMSAKLDWPDRSESPSFLLQRQEDAAFAPLPPPSQALESTELNWLDISFQYLWWEATAIAGEAKILGRNCVAIDVRAPNESGPYGGARLWIDPEIGGLLEAEFYSHTDNRLKKLKIKSLRKIEDLWFPKEIEVINSKNRRRTRIMTYTDTVDMLVFVFAK